MWSFQTLQTMINKCDPYLEVRFTFNGFDDFINRVIVILIVHLILNVRDTDVSHCPVPALSQSSWAHPRELRCSLVAGSHRAPHEVNMFRQVPLLVFIICRHFNELFSLLIKRAQRLTWLDVHPLVTPVRHYALASALASARTSPAEPPPSLLLIALEGENINLWLSKVTSSELIGTTHYVCLLHR